MKVFGQGMVIQNRMPQLIKIKRTYFSREMRRRFIIFMTSCKLKQNLI